MSELNEIAGLYGITGADQSRYLERVRWRCRRGLLELDIVLERFITQHYAGLDEVGQAAIDALLDLPDTELWGLISCENIAGENIEAQNITVINQQYDAVLKLLRSV